MIAQRAQQSTGASTVRRHITTTAAQRGLTLVELLCSLAITMALLGSALPMLNDLVMRQRLQAQAALLETDLVLARAAAMSTGRTVRLAAKQADDGSSCYVIHVGPIGSCTCSTDGQPRCEAGGEALRSVAVAQHQGLRLVGPSRSIAFDAKLGTVTPTATFRLSDAQGRTVNQVINITGRVRTCTPNPTWGGMRRC